MNEKKFVDQGAVDACAKDETCISTETVIDSGVKA